MTLAESLVYLQERMAVLSAQEPRNRHWKLDDIEAVMRLIERPAASEQIALARIEGYSSAVHGFSESSRLARVNAIARRALGLAVSK